VFASVEVTMFTGMFSTSRPSRGTRQRTLSVTAELTLCRWDPAQSSGDFFRAQPRSFARPVAKLCFKSRNIGPCPTSVCSDSLLSYASGYGHTQIANSFPCPWEIHGPHPYRCAYMPSNPRDGCVGVPNLHDLCALHHTLCLGMRGQEQVVNMLMTHGADGMQRDDGSDSCLSLSPPDVVFH